MYKRSIELFEMSFQKSLSLFFKPTLDHILGVRYQYFAAPATPTKATTYATTSLNAIAYINTGVPLYNPLSNYDGSLASYNEWTSLDPCYGHSSPDSQYHYHAVSFPKHQQPV